MIKFFIIFIIAMPPLMAPTRSNSADYGGFINNPAASFLLYYCYASSAFFYLFFYFLLFYIAGIVFYYLIYSFFFMQIKKNQKNCLLFVAEGTHSEKVKQKQLNYLKIIFY